MRKTAILLALTLLGIMPASKAGPIGISFGLTRGTAFSTSVGPDGDAFLVWGSRSGVGTGGGSTSDSEGSRPGDEDGFVLLVASYNGGRLTAEGLRGGPGYPLDPLLEGGTFSFEAEVTEGRCEGGTASVSMTVAGFGVPVPSVSLNRSLRVGNLSVGLTGHAQLVRPLEMRTGTISSCMGVASFGDAVGALFEGATGGIRLTGTPAEATSDGGSGHVATVSSDGSRATRHGGTGGSFSPGYEGTLGSRESATDETVIGSTDSRQQTANTSAYPMRAIGRVTVTFGTGSLARRSACTAWLIGPDTAVTSGHCVYNGDLIGRGSWGRNVTFTPGQRDATSTPPFGSCGAKKLHSIADWTEDFDDDYDYGAIKLNCSIGNTVGSFGFFWTDNDIDDLPTTIRGYPGDMPSGTQWVSHDRVRDSSSTYVYYANDTEGGMSGSPVYYNRKGCKCSMAIHKGNWDDDENLGILINEDVYSKLVYWKKL
jgi:glutamyl endopeptidase